MFTLFAFLAMILIFAWSRSRFGELERKLNGLERRLMDLQRAQEPAPEAAPPMPTPPEPARPEAQPIVETAVPVPPLPAIEPPPIPIEKEAPPALPPQPPPSPAYRPIYSSWKMPMFDWESVVGVKLFSWIAGVALLLAAVFFLKYSINQGWLVPQVRMAIGIIVGIGLLVLCELKAARKYPITANAMDASASAILFSTFFAAHALWNLIGAVPAFALMVLVTAVAVLLAIRRDSAFIALLGLLGGFATPALLSSGENSPFSLFGYLVLLNAGLAWVAAKRKWPLLTTLSLVFTVLYQWGWVTKFLTAAQMPIAIGIFLVFPILAYAALALDRKEEPVKGWMALYGQTANFTALLPLLFVLYWAAVPAYGQRFALLFGFLFLLDAGLFAIAVARGPQWIHLAGGISTILVWAIWLRSSYARHAWPEILAFVLLFGFFYLAVPTLARRFNRGFTSFGKYAVYAAPVLLFVIPCLAALEPAAASPGLAFGVLFLILLGISAYAIRAEEGFMYYIGAVFALIGETVWSIKYLTPEHLYSGLALYAAFGLFYIGVPIVAHRLRKKLRPEAAGAAMLLVSLALLFFLAAGSVAAVSIWGLALLLLVLNAGLFWQGAASRLPILAIAGMVLSWIILGVLWMSISLAAVLVPALLVVAGFALLVLAGNIWLQKQAAGDAAAIPASGIFLGLTGHIFLAAIAAQRSLGDPPWPLLGILLLLDLAIGAAALYTRRNDIHRAAMVASALVLMIWVSVLGIAPAPSVAIISAGTLAFLSFAWIYLAKRRGIELTPFSRTAAITVILAQIVAIVAAFQPGSPGVGFLLAAHLVFLIALLALEWFRGTYVFAVIAVLTTAIGVSAWSILHSDAGYWPQLLLFAAPIYLMFIAYPLILGRRSGRSLLPYLGAVLASIPFFFQARHAIVQAGWGSAIGVLPVVQALLLAILLMRLLKIEPAGARYLGRLALVAGAALAFVTAAIPLQLEKEWITIGWALEGAALAWLYGKIPHKGLLYAASGLFAAVFIRLALNPSVLFYRPRAGVRIWNWYLYTYLVSSAALILGGRLLARTKDALLDSYLRVSKVLPGGGVLLLFLLLNIEIADFYSIGRTIAFNFTATLAQDLTYTLGWAVFAVTLLAVGIVIRSQPARIASLALLVITIIKCFFHDLARLGGLYRVASFVGLAVCLALVALVLQRFILSARKGEK